MTFQESSNSPVIRSTPLSIKIRGCGNIVSFKNSKMIARGRLITDPKKQKAMDSYIRAIESALRSAIQMNAGATSTEERAQFLTALLGQSQKFDDNRMVVPSLVIDCIEVDPGEEGVDILIERI